MPVLTFVIAGHEDHPIFEADLSVRESAGRDERAQYLHQVFTFPEFKFSIRKLSLFSRLD